MNIGKIELLRIDEPWKMNAGEPEVCGEEFEEFTDMLGAFVDGYFYSKGIYSPPFYCCGDFHYERTEALYCRDSKSITKDFIACIMRWLDVPRRKDWRVVVPGEGKEKTDIVIYHSKIIGFE